VTSCAPAVTPPVVPKPVKKELVLGTDYVREGWWGVTEPIRNSKRYLQDGGGLCSPGRWPPAERSLPPQGREITALLDKVIDELVGEGGQHALDDLAFGYMAGKFTSDPFGSSAVDGRRLLEALLASKGLARPVHPRRKGPEIDFGLMHMLGSFLQDPDASSMLEFVRGVRIGVDVELHRTLAVWPPKVRWPLPPFDEFEATALNENYPSASQHHHVLESELLKQVSRGWLREFTLAEATRRYGKVTVSSMAVLEEKAGVFRTLTDASNRSQVNRRIRVRDAEQCPTAVDIQMACSACGGLPQPVLGISTDVEKAHRAVPVAEEDWRHLGCAIQPKPADPAKLGSWKILLNTVGTYGVGSASWLWARPASLLQRMGYYTCELDCIFRFADDFLLIFSGKSAKRNIRPLVRFMLLCSLLGVPLKWTKTGGGPRTEFVGYLFLWDSLQGGLSDRRAEWLINWAERTAQARAAETRELKGALGRFSFSATLLRFLLPFLGPIYAYVSALEEGSTWPLPPAIIIILRWIAEKLRERQMVGLVLTKPVLAAQTFYADAKAEDGVVVVGGYEAFVGLPLSHCRWFSYHLTPSCAPWAFSKVGEAYRVIAALELFATLLCLLLFGAAAPVGGALSLALHCVTDNQGNEALIAKNMTTKFPLYLILLEITELVNASNWSLQLSWKARELNQTADDLTNDKFDEFDANLRLNPPLDQLPWKVLPRLYQDAFSLHSLVTAKKVARAGLVQTKRLPARKKRKLGLRVTDPWG
jgi:hypothetical protein